MRAPVRSSLARPARRLVLSIPVLLATAAAADAREQDLSAVEIRTTKVADGVYMLEGAGGNVGLSVGEDAAFLVDDQFAPLTRKITAAIAAITDEPVRFVLNTHWHPDHTGGNENLGEAGALILAHENVRTRLSTEQFSRLNKVTVPPSPAAALPVVTFTDAVTFHLNGDEIHAFHVAPAHTDGDAVVHFRRANVVHMGDTFFAGSYPFIDLGSGGSVDGVIAAADRVLAIVDRDTRVIPGHGPLSDRAGLERFRDMLVTVRDRVREAVGRGATLREVVASKPTAEFDSEHPGRLPAETFVGIIYDDAKRWLRRPRPPSERAAP